MEPIQGPEKSEDRFVLHQGHACPSSRLGKHAVLFVIQETLVPGRIAVRAPACASLQAAAKLIIISVSVVPPKVLQDESCIRMMEKFIRENPSLWNEAESVGEVLEFSGKSRYLPAVPPGVLLGTPNGICHHASHGKNSNPRRRANQSR